MSRMLASRMGYEPERSLAAASIGATYAASGLVGLPFTHQIRILVLQNGTDHGVSFSLDGVNTLITLQSGVNVVLDITAARVSGNQGFAAPIGWGLWVKKETVAATTGSVYATAIYGAGAESL